MNTCPDCQSLLSQDALSCSKCGAISFALKQTPASVEGRILAQKYRVEGSIKSGGMGTVYIARHLVFNEIHAVKALHPQLAHNERFKQRFMVEANLTRKASRHSPHIVDIYDFGADEFFGNYLSMEYLKGCSLSERLSDTSLPPLTLRQLLEISIQLCKGLAVAHEIGIVHRDIKPGNIFLVDPEKDKPHVKLIDFGIAMPEVGLVDENNTASQFIGSPAYIAPEQTLTPELCQEYGWPIGNRIDIYSMGAVLYKCLTGVSPLGSPGKFSSVEEVLEILRRHLKTTPTPPHEAAPQNPIPQELSDFVMQTLSKSPLERPLHMRVCEEKLTRLLKSFEEQGSILEEPLTHKQNKHKFISLLDPKNDFLEEDSASPKPPTTQRDEPKTAKPESHAAKPESHAAKPESHAVANKKEVTEEVKEDVERGGEVERPDSNGVRVTLQKQDLTEEAFPSTTDGARANEDLPFVTEEPLQDFSSWEEDELSDSFFESEPRSSNRMYYLWLMLGIGMIAGALVLWRQPEVGKKKAPVRSNPAPQAQAPQVRARVSPVQRTALSLSCPASKPNHRMIQLVALGQGLADVHVFLEQKQVPFVRDGCLHIPTQAKQLSLRHKKRIGDFHPCVLQLSNEVNRYMFRLVESSALRPEKNNCLYKKGRGK